MAQLVNSPLFWIVVALLVSGLLLWIASFFIVSYCIYTRTLKKINAKTWTRELASNIPPEQKQMYKIGLAWAEENKNCKNDVHIVNDGLNLYGEYYDFKSSKCAVILSGRTECLKYGYYFAIPYAKKRL